MNDQVKKIKKIAEGVGKLLRECQGKNIDTVRKADNTYLTVADTDADKFWRQALQKYFPGDRIVTEETFVPIQMEKISQGRVWVIDPLDGTSSFKNREKSYTTMAALLVEGKVMLSLVHQPTTNDTYYAIKGEGSYLNNKPLHVSSVSRREDLRMVRRHTLSNNLEEIVYALHCKEVAVSGSLGLKLSLIASGLYDITVYDTEPSFWDVLPGALILEEAGGMVTDLFGKIISPLEINAKGVLATNGKIHSQLLRFIQPLSSVVKKYESM